MKLTLSVLLFAVVVSGPMCAAEAQVASSIRLKAADSTLYATVDGVEKKIAHDVHKAWRIDGGHEVVYSAADGAGGYENEGEGLHVYELSSGKERKLMAAFFVIQRVESVSTKLGATALLVTMTDGGLGATHVVVANLARGEVFSADGARFLGRRANRIVVGTYRDEDWERLQADAKIRPQSVKSYDLDVLMKMPVIENTPAA